MFDFRQWAESLDVSELEGKLYYYEKIMKYHPTSFNTEALQALKNRWKQECDAAKNDTGY